MFVAMGMHRPKPEHEQDLIDSMHRFREVGKKQPGCRMIGAFKADEKGLFVGVAVWDSREDWDRARPLMGEAVKDDPFDDWETAPIKMMFLTEV